MQVRGKTLKPAYGFWISIRSHGHVVSAVPHIDPCGMRMNYLQTGVL